MHWGKVWGKVSVSRHRLLNPSRYRAEPDLAPVHRTGETFRLPIVRRSTLKVSGSPCCRHVRFTCRPGGDCLGPSLTTFFSGEQGDNGDLSPKDEPVAKRHRLKSFYYSSLCFETPSLRLQVRTSPASPEPCLRASYRAPASLPRWAWRRGRRSPSSRSPPDRGSCPASCGVRCRPSGT